MFWVVHCTDRPDASEQRRVALAEQMLHVASAPVRVLSGGPLMADAVEPRSGSVLLVEASCRDNVEHFVNTAPFAVHGVWSAVQINEFKPLLGGLDSLVSADTSGGRG